MKTLIIVFGILFLTGSQSTTKTLKLPMSQRTITVQIKQSTPQVIVPKTYFLVFSNTNPYNINYFIEYKIDTNWLYYTNGQCNAFQWVSNRLDTSKSNAIFRVAFYL